MTFSEKLKFYSSIAGSCFQMVSSKNVFAMELNWEQQKCAYKLFVANPSFFLCAHEFYDYSHLDNIHLGWLQPGEPPHRTTTTKDKRRLGSDSVTRVNDSTQSFWLTNPVCLHTNKWSFFGLVMIKIGANFLFRLSSRVMLYPYGQVFITCTKVDLRFAFHWGARRAQYRPIDTSSWSNQVFAYHDNGSRPHTVTLSLFHVTWLKLFKYKSNAKIYSSI